MSKKLSELKDGDMLIVDGYDVVSKEDFLNDFEFYKNKADRVYTTTQYHAVIDVEEMLMDAFESESNNMYEDWLERIEDYVTEEDIEDLQKVVDRILSRNESINISYIEDEKVEIDL